MTKCMSACVRVYSLVFNSLCNLKAAIDIETDIYIDVKILPDKDFIKNATTIYSGEIEFMYDTTI